MLLWKRGSSLVSQRLRTCGLLPHWCGLIDHNPLKGHREHPQRIALHNRWLRWTYHTGYTIKDLINSRKQYGETTPLFLNIVYKCLFKCKKGICYRDLHWNGPWFIDTNLRSILLYVYVFLILIKVLCLFSSFKNVMYN